MINFSRQKNFKTSNALIFVLVLIFSVLPLLISVILIGDINALGLNQFVAYNSVLWTGNVTTDNLQYLIDTYSMFSLNQSEFIANLNNYVSTDKQIVILSEVTYSSLMVWIVVISLFTFSFLYPIVPILLKKASFDLYVFSISSAIFMLIIFVSGLLPNFDSNLATIWWMLRILLATFVAGIIFFIINWLVNNIIIRSNFAAQYLIAINDSNKEAKFYHHELKNSVEQYKKNKQQKEYVEIEAILTEEK